MRPKIHGILAAWAMLAVSTGAAVPLDPIDADRPWFVFRAPEPSSADMLAYTDNLRTAWQALPERLRPVAAFEVAAPTVDYRIRPDVFEDVLTELQFAQIPMVVAITDDDPASFYPRSDLERLFDTFTLIRGVHVRGLRFDDYPVFGDGNPLATPPQVRWLAALIETASDYGRRVVLELDGLHTTHLMANAWAQPVRDAMADHPNVVVPMNSQRGPHSVVASSALLGLWLEDTVGQWGLRLDSKWYVNANFVEPGVYGRDPEAIMPPELYRAMLLNGAMAGATVYRFSEAADLWTGVRGGTWRDVIAPTLIEILDNGYLARERAVLETIQIGYRLNPSRSREEFAQHAPDLDPIFDEGRLLFGAYGLEMPGQVPELVLNTGRYYWIPILSPGVSDEAIGRFEEVLLPGALLNAQEWRERLASYYPARADGSAFVTTVGRGIFVLHTRENAYAEQTFAIEAVPAPVRGVRANRTPEGVELAWPFREGDVFYRVYRRVLPDGDWLQVSDETDERRFVDITANERDATLAYAVTALTNETEPYSGTLNYGDYRVVNTVESRIVEEVILEAEVVAATAAPLPLPIDDRPASQPAWPDLEDLEGDALFAARAVVSQIERLEVGFVNSDPELILSVYAPRYVDSEGSTREVVRAAFAAFFQRTVPGRMARQIRSWDVSGLPDGVLGVTLYTSFSGKLRPPYIPEAGNDTLHFPAANGGVVTMTFEKTGDDWLLTRTEPPLPGLDDVLGVVPRPRVRP